MQHKIPQKILIIQTAFLGDIILSTCLIEKLSEYYPNATIDLLVKKGNESVLKNHPKINRLWLWDKRQKYRSLFELIKPLKSQQYDYVINAQRHSTTAFLTYCIKPKNSIGFNTAFLSFLYTKRIPYPIVLQHETQKMHLLIKHLTDDKAGKMKLYASLQEKQLAQQYITKKYITISPVSLWFTKTYPYNKWIEFIKQLPLDYTIYLLGSKNDINVCELIKKECLSHHIINLSGQLNLLASGELMKYAQMNYANDSAPTHIASAFDAPISTLFCSTSASFGFAPISTISFIIEIKEDLKCRPCTNHGKTHCPKKHFNCAEKITPQQLLDILPK